jgi:hypothetical protein
MSLEVATGPDLEILLGMLMAEQEIDPAKKEELYLALDEVVAKAENYSSGPLEFQKFFKDAMMFLDSAEEEMQISIVKRRVHPDDKKEDICVVIEQVIPGEAASEKNIIGMSPNNDGSHSIAIEEEWADGHNPETKYLNMVLEDADLKLYWAIMDFKKLV